MRVSNLKEEGMMSGMGWREFSCLAGIILFGTVLFLHCALFNLDFNDIPGFMDAAHRLLQGQRLYTDFFYHAGPVHLYMHALFFIIFGYNVGAIQAHLVFISLVPAVLLFLMGRRVLGIWKSTALSVLSLFCFAGPLPHPWYDHNSALFLIVAAFLCEQVRTALSRKAALWIGFFCGVLAALSVFTKTNVGVAGTLFLLIPFLLSESRRFLLLGYAVGGVVLTLIIFGTVQDFSVFKQMFTLHAANRLGQMQRLIAVLEFSPYMGTFFVLYLLFVLGGKTTIKQSGFYFSMALGTIVLSLFSVWTGSIANLANIHWLAVVCFYLFMIEKIIYDSLYPFSRPETKWHAYGAKISIWVVFGYSMMASVLATALSLGLTGHPSNSVNDYELQTKELKGWHCYSGIGEGVDRAIEEIKRTVPLGDSLFVFPTPTFIYGLTNHESYKKVPYLFVVEKAPMMGEQYNEFKEHFMHFPPNWILLHIQEDRPYYSTKNLVTWLGIGEELDTHYRTTWSFKNFYLLKRKNAD